ncbi:hypothetical protein CEP54_007007 [Fusarium duplospermum]|uniref:Uncharacterized protein n=1 Tax=Fusarium duplospermum TaxID=1325734 RepID=A0A428Q3S9_9HYPO|nr:hypothetical protein CEP54_007007 [Fusarium duplospermum]
MNCSSEELTKLVAKGEVPFDADVAGPGVVTAFIATSLTALITLIVAFATFSVPPRLLNTADVILAEGVRSLFRIVSKPVRSLFGIVSNRDRNKTVKDQEARINAFMTFMVSVSDQILVSEAAILVAGLIGHEELTLYSTNIIIALGCLASTVHLGTFPFFIERLKEHHTAKLMRVLIMSAGSGMLIFLLVVQLSATWNTKTHVFFWCTLHDYKINAKDYLDCIVSLAVPIVILHSTISIVRLLYAPTPLGDANERRQEDGDGDRAGVSPSRERSYGNVSRRRAPRDRETNRERREQGTGQVRRNQNDQPTRIPHEDNNRRYHHDDDLELVQQRSHLGNRQEEAVTAYEIESQQSPKARSRFFRGLYEATRPSNRDNLLSTWLQKKGTAFLSSRVASGTLFNFKVNLVAESWAFHQCQGSFVYKMLWLWSGNVYGIVAVFTARTNTTGMSGERDKMGFGQIVPLALLVLPLFAALQSKADYEERLEFRKSQQAHQNGPEHQPRASSVSVREPNLSPGALLLNTPERPLTERLARLEDKSIQLDRLYLFDWARRGNLERSAKLRSYVFLHTSLMFVFTTLLGFFMAYGEYPIATLVLSVLFLLPTLRKVVGLITKFWYTRSQSSLTGDGQEDQEREVRGHGYQMAGATTAEGTQEV